MNAAQHVFECDDLKKKIFSYCLPKYRKILLPFQTCFPDCWPWPQAIITKKMIDTKMVNLAFEYIEPCIDETIKGRCLKSAWFRTLQLIKYDNSGYQDTYIPRRVVDRYFARLPDIKDRIDALQQCYKAFEFVDTFDEDDEVSEASSSEEEEPYEPYEPLLPDDDESSLEDSFHWIRR